MTEHWFRYFHGTPSDPKWKVVAARASHTMSRRVTIANVLAVWNCMMDCASQATPRGELAGWDSEDVAACLELEQAEVDAIHAAMQGKTLDGNSLMSWEKRQPKREREDPGAAARQAASRQAKRERDAAAAGVTDEGHTASHHVTPRGEESREEKKEQKTEALSVGKVGTTDSRAHDDPPEPRPTEAIDPAKCTPAGEVGKALVAAGIPKTQINLTHPAMRALLEAGVPANEIGDAAREAVAAGKASMVYVCRMVWSRRQEADKRGTVPSVKPVAGSGAHRAYTQPKRVIDRSKSDAAQAQSMAALLKTVGLPKKPEEPGETPTP